MNRIVLKPRGKPKPAPTPVTSFYDARSDGFERTALVVDAGASVGSFELVAHDAEGNLYRLAQINVCHYAGGEGISVDVIDVDERWSKKRALTFSRQDGRIEMQAPADGSIVCAAFDK